MELPFKETNKDLISKLTNDTAFYFELTKVTFCHIILFNRKRGGDVLRITVENYKQTFEAQNNAPCDNEVISSLTETEIELYKFLTRIELKGKKAESSHFKNDMVRRYRIGVKQMQDIPFCTNIRGKICLEGCMFQNWSRS